MSPVGCIHLKIILRHYNIYQFHCYDDNQLLQDRQNLIDE